MVKRILVVDDDHLIRGLARSTLESSGFEVYEATDGREALEAVVGVRPDLILLDVWMPRLDGLAVMRELRRSEARVVLLTGLEPEQEPTPELLELCHDRLDKPFSPAELAAMVERHLSPSEEHQLEPDDRQRLLRYARELERANREDHRKTRQLREANRRLKELEKMKDVFLSLVSHELRTPLTIIKGDLHLLRRLLPDSGDAAVIECLDGAHTACQRLERLIGELLSFSGVQSGLDPAGFRAVRVAQLLDAVAREHQPLARARGVFLSVRPPESWVVVAGDAARLREAISHVVKNAVLFNRQGGRVDVEVSAGDDEVRLSVRDQGSGIAPEDQQQVFSPFYQAGEVTTRRVEGLGLGLSITRHIVEGHGGTVELDSHPGRGTLVRLRLPVRRVAELPATSLPEPVPAPQDAGADSDHLLVYARELYSSYDAERVRRKHLEEERRELESTFIQTVGALTAMVDPRGTRPAIDRVASYARAMACHLDPSLADTRDFIYSLLLYDVGKIGIAESVLHKAGELTEEERLQVQAHTEIGADILGSIRSLRPAIEGVRSHHERWDGSGYPDGLRGAEIPLIARIIAVADSFDAMTVDRPYRKAMTPDRAREEILGAAGTSFDPTVVRAFEQAWEEISGIAAGRAQERQT